MSKLLITCAAAAVTALVALPASASPAQKQQGDTSMKTSEQIEVSSARRHHRRYTRHYHYGPRYYRPYYGRSYYAPYNAYGYDPYYRPYYRPGFSVGVGPFGFGFGF